MNAVVITCEHGGNEIPTPYQPLFAGEQELLSSHRGLDFGALVLAKELAASFRAPIIASTTSRLLIDLNRSVGHRQSLSEVTRSASREVRGQIVERHFRPHRDEVEAAVRHAVVRGERVIHIAAHSFTPELHGKVRTTDVGLLYDPRRPGEVELCGVWKTLLTASAPEFRVRRNYPFAGKGDGLTTDLRKIFAPDEYVGIEVEVNQAIVLEAGSRWRALRRALIDSLHRTVLE